MYWNFLNGIVGISSIEKKTQGQWEKYWNFLKELNVLLFNREDETDSTTKNDRAGRA